MTWVVGAINPFGGAAIVADTRVTFRNGTEADLVQKAYCVGRYVVAGFSGSVQIGFHVLADLHQQLSQLADPEASWKPNVVARQWHRRAAAIFEQHVADERKLGCSILLAGPSPDENNGDGPWAKSYLVRMTAPSFAPGFSRNGIAALHVGSGSKVGEYQRRVRTYFRDPRFAVRFGSWGPGSFGAMLASSVGGVAAEHQAPGVGPHLHFVACGRGSLTQGTNERQEFCDDGPIVVNPMPGVATNYKQFCLMAKSAGQTAAEATA